MIQIKCENIENLTKLHLKNINDIISEKEKISFDFFKDNYTNFEELITSKPNILEKTIEKFKENSTNYSLDFEKNKQILIGLYNKFRNKFGVQFVENLNITVCPFCNREYVFKFDDTKQQKTRTLSTLDHFYDKASYPFLAVSFYNLIPTCSICNSKFKNQKDFYAEKHLHPLLHNFNLLAKFHLKIENSEFYYSTKGIDIELTPINENDVKTKNTISTFRLYDIYQNHKDIVLEIIKKKNMYSEDYLKVLFKQYEGTLFKNYEQLQGLVLGNYISDDEIQNRPLAKLTKDISEELGLI